MKTTGNTILITGGGSGIGRGLAEALQATGNTVIIAGRRKEALAETLEANPGMKSVELDIQDPAKVTEVSAQLVKDYPELNVLINNAGIMKETRPGSGVIDEDSLASTLTTNLLGPIRLTGALLEHLKGKQDAVVMNVTSGLAFIPMVPVSVYCATKAALHSYTLSLRFDLKDTGVTVMELVPPYVQTDLFNGANDPRAMPLKEFIDETMELLATDAEEICGKRASMLRAPGDAAKEWQKTDGFNTMMAADPH